MKIVKKLLFIACFFILLVAGGTYYLLNKPTVKEDTKITLKHTTSAKDALEKLAYQNAFSLNEQLIASRYLTKIKRFKQVKAGHYSFEKGSSINEIINTLRAGKQTPVKLTFNNTRTIADFAGKISNQLLPDSVNLLQFLQNPQTAKSYGFDTATFIGMFIPNTYEFYYTTMPKAFTDRMFNEYKAFWTTNRRNKAKALKMTPNEVSSLAAIIDEETSKNDEKRRIAGVYINRLHRGIPLQADPTLKFAAGDFTLRRILNEHKNINSPYNTYKNNGLPPGPIRQPSISAIDAVLNYERHSYIYFCAKADFSGYHAFAKTLAEHNRNAALYHRELNKRGIK